MTIFTPEQLNDFSAEQMRTMYISLQDQLAEMNKNMEVMAEQLRLMQVRLYGRKTEKMDQIPGQLSLFDNAFNEAEASADPAVAEPDPEIVLSVRRRKKAGKRDADLMDLPHEIHRHELTDSQLDEFFGKGCWRRFQPDTYLRLRIQPAVFTVEEHIVDAAVGTDGDHQDEYLRGNRPADLIRESVVTHSLMAAILNSKYVNALPYYRIEQQFRSEGIGISRQTMSNWTIAVSQRYLKVVWDRLRRELLKQPVTQADETTVQVIHDNDPNDPSDTKKNPGHKNYMWVHRSGQFNRQRQVVLFEYQRGRAHHFPKEFYKDYKGIVETDGLQQYHMLERMIPEYTNASCWTHARRSFMNAVKALPSKDKAVAAGTVAGQALIRIGRIYEIENKLADMSAEERLRERKKQIEPLVDEFFAWVKEVQPTVLPKGETGRGLNYCINQEKYLRVFLTNGDVPIDNSASERSIRPFTIGRKNWMFINTVKGADASAIVYSIVETAKANGLNVYRYLDCLLEELPQRMNEDGTIDPALLEELLPWSPPIREKCEIKKKN